MINKDHGSTVKIVNNALKGCMKRFAYSTLQIAPDVTLTFDQGNRFDYFPDPCCYAIRLANQTLYDKVFK